MWPWMQLVFSFLIIALFYYSVTFAGCGENNFDGDTSEFGDGLTRQDDSLVSTLSYIYFAFAVVIIAIALWGTFSIWASPVHKVLSLLLLSLSVTFLWISVTQFLFIYLVYILAFIGAVLMLFLSVVLMLPISTTYSTRLSNSSFMLIFMSGQGGGESLSRLLELFVATLQTPLFWGVCFIWLYLVFIVPQWWFDQMSSEETRYNLFYWCEEWYYYNVRSLLPHYRTNKSTMWDAHDRLYTINEHAYIKYQIVMLDMPEEYRLHTSWLEPTQAEIDSNSFKFPFFLVLPPYFERYTIMQEISNFITLVVAGFYVVMPKLWNVFIERVKADLICVGCKVWTCLNGPNNPLTKENFWNTVSNSKWVASIMYMFIYINVFLAAIPSTQSVPAVTTVPTYEFETDTDGGLAAMKDLLYNEYGMYLFTSVLVLLVALIGAAVITRSKRR